jgi:hypothetical protein
VELEESGDRIRFIHRHGVAAGNTIVALFGSVRLALSGIIAKYWQTSPMNPRPIFVLGLGQ